MPNFDPNIMLGILQGMQGGQAFPTSVPGLNEQMLPKLEHRLGGLGADQLSALTTGFQNYAPTWQEGQRWGRQDILGHGGRFGGFGNGGGMGQQPQMGGMMGGGMKPMGDTPGMGGNSMLRGRGGK